MVTRYFLFVYHFRINFYFENLRLFQLQKKKNYSLPYTELATPSENKGVFLRIFEKKEEFAKNKKSFVIFTGRMHDQEYQNKTNTNNVIKYKSVIKL